MAWVRGGSLLAVGLGSPQVASAHLVSSGMGSLYDGMAHFYLTPMDWLVVVGLALWAGLKGADRVRALVVGVPLGWLAGLGAGMQLAGLEMGAWYAPVTVLVVGLLVALDLRGGCSWVVLAGGAVALVHGFENGRTMVATGTSLGAAAGITLAAGAGVLVAGALANAQQGGWRRIAVRAVGSWVAAIGLLSLAWELRPVA